MFDLVLVFAEFALAGFMFYVYSSLNEKQQVFKFLYFGMGLLFLILACYTVFLVGQVPGQRIESTNESSHVWNCTDYGEYCFGEPEPKSCYWYLFNQTQCEDIDGCTYDIQAGCYGTPEWTCTELYDYGGETKCEETKGCFFSLSANPQTCDSYDTQYYYGEYETGYEGSAGFMETVAWILAILLGFFVMVVIISWVEAAYNDITNEKKMPEEELERPF